MRENSAAKGRRLLTEGRVVVQRVEQNRVAARVRGDEGTFYRVRYEFNEWRCNCPARGNCSHLVALKLITSVDLEERR